jgi:2-polyprenyl-6-methoxyphenol hydroxylase-like FAD-dependent oxidoreductase
MLANQLARLGVRPMIIDRHDGPAVQTRALGVQARTLEIYAQLGIAARAIELGRKATGADMWTLGRWAARVPLGDIGRNISAYPYLLILGQDDNERLLGEALQKQGVTVGWSTELVGLQQTPDQVVARLRQSDGTIRELRAAWVAGCDGTRSAVRELNHIEFQGAPYEHVFFVADTRIIGAMVPDEVNVYLWPHDFLLFFPMRGPNHWRLVGMLPAALRARDDVTLDDVIPSIRKEAGSALTFQSCSWFSTYRIHHRMAERFREGRCFVLGDAAHTHSPVGAQGMNTGLQDAYNLGWKLALVVNGRAGPALLDSYADERVPVARRLLSTTDRMFSVVISGNRLAGLLRTRVWPKALAFGMRLGWVQRLAFRTISQTGIRYRESRLSETLPGVPKNAPRAGDRCPWLRLKFTPSGPVEDLYDRLDGIRFTLLLFGQPAPAGGVPGADDQLRSIVVPPDPANDAELARARIPGSAFYLLRPDGYIGLAGLGLDTAGVTRYLSERLGLRPAAS